MSAGRVIVLNGVGSVGKSSIVQALRPLARPGLRVVTMDDHLAALPPDSFGTPAGLTFKTHDAGGAPVTEIIAGPLVTTALAEMWRTVAAIAGEGENVVVDIVLLGPEPALPDILAHADVRLVAVTAPLTVIEARERARGDRLPGLARWQHDRVHVGRRYDLTIDTARGTPADHAAAIRAAFDL